MFLAQRFFTAEGAESAGFLPQRAQRAQVFYRRGCRERRFFTAEGAESAGGMGIILDALGGKHHVTLTPNPSPAGAGEGRYSLPLHDACPAYYAAPLLMPYGGSRGRRMRANATAPRVFTAEDAEVLERDDPPSSPRWWRALTGPSVIASPRDGQSRALHLPVGSY
ncbi:hypothetical protein A6A03_00210 [Chloroflexus islandicus]|uniref:Uncharacterized protein n=1 Tax=Chloroflexus islandicus TaxID=1707952 RepID=A0A178MGG3_9CHLR|nr:hypothetical protein A6A03_00210 [Chloroflexus islandicus]